MELNEPQEQAVLHSSGPLLVFAGAGSGKTRVITYRVANLVARHAVPPYRILSVTFTNKAASEMKQRLESLAGEQLTRELWVGTFHSVCCRLLRRYHDEVGLERSFVIYDDSDQKALLTRIIRDMGLDERTYPPRAILSRIHSRKQEGHRPRDVELTPYFDTTCVELFERYEAALKNSNAVDFDDLILHIMRLAEDAASPAGRELRTRFDHLLVDEFQDTNGVQYRLVRALAARTQNLCVVGDDDQSIYSWRGADIRNIRGFHSDFKSATVVKLEQNYRSTGNIVAAALGVITPAAARVPKNLWTAHSPGDPVRVHACRDERDEAQFVVNEVRGELARGTSADKIAVFYRINAQSRVLEEAFRRQRIDYQIVGGMRFFDRAEVKDVMAYLRLVENPRSDADLMRIINVPARGIGNKTVDRLLAFAADRGSCAYDAIAAAAHDKSFATAARKKLLGFAALLEELRGVSQQLLPSELARQVLEQTGYRKILHDADSAEADARLENLEEFLGSIQEYEAEAERSEEPATLSGYLERVSLVADIDRVESGPSVLLMTVHSAKGLEFDAVFLTGMEEEMFPYRGLDADSVEELEEERRLAYVAITRARRRLCISYAGIRTIFGQTRYGAPSRFLADLPGDGVSHEGHAWASPRSQRDPFAVITQSSLPQQAEWEYSQLESHEAHAPLAAPTRDPETEGERVIDYDAFDDVSAEESQVQRPSRVKKGSRVHHKRFGTGVIERVERGAHVIARFPGYGERKVLASYLRFE